MIKQLQDETFAVVDLETTGTQKQRNNHIIQFGCAIIKNLKVVKTYSLMINPHQPIPVTVQNLTGIHDADVATAPDFSHYGAQILDILAGTTFVAHNVNFDLPFLNEELVEHGFDPFTGRAIDTVELAKVAFPTLPSYRLSDLTHQLQIKHLAPHQADSDAYGTAILLIKIIRRLAQLPQATLNTLSSLAHGLVRNTSWIFTVIATASRQTRRPLRSDCMQVRSLILQRQQHTLPRRGKRQAFPEQDQEKRRLFKPSLNYRREQVNLINQLHAFIRNPAQRALLFEAPNGTGKTFSYLFSYAYQLDSGRKLVIATPTKVLQDQILQHEIPQLLKVTGLDLTAEVVKSSNHYIDLDGFMQTVYQGSTNIPNIVLQMQILVWLTMTKTGDLDELELTNYAAPLFTKIAHPGDARVGSTFAKVDFWNLARMRQEQADILVTNHAYLANHYVDSIWGPNPYLVIDEAHCFADNVMASRHDALQVEALWGVISHLRNTLFYDNDSVQSAFGTSPQLKPLLTQLDDATNKFIKRINHLQTALYERADLALAKQDLRQGIELIFEGTVLFPAEAKFSGALAAIGEQLEQIRQTTNELLFYLYQEPDNNLTDDLLATIDELDFYTEKGYQLADVIGNPAKLVKTGFVLQITNPADPLSTNIHWLMLDVSELIHQIYDRFDHIAFSSATLTHHHSFNFAINQLSVSHLAPITYIGKSTFNYTLHLQVLAVNDLPQPDSANYLPALEQLLINDLQTKKHVLVLMTNLAQIKEVFSAILNEPFLADFEILAQGLSGSNQKIAKRFAIAKQAIILGADSFWEGIDFHDCGIDVVIASKLPFQSPQQPEVQLRQQKLIERGLDVFENDALPRAVIKFRQGIGRLIRGEADYGQFVILDPRIWDKAYGKAFLQAIPVHVQKIKQQELKSKLDNYESLRK